MSSDSPMTRCCVDGTANDIAPIKVVTHHPVTQTSPVEAVSLAYASLPACDDDDHAVNVQTFVFVCLAIYEVLSHYKMTSEPRGYCLIINMANFDKGPDPLPPRTGADKDVGQFCVFLPVLFLAL